MSENSGRRAFFAAANSGDGFVSIFEDTFFGDNIRKRYIIKGGPGTGKSSFMRRVGSFAEKRGAEVEYYYCSSDTNSLDGLIINGEIAMLDGTAPHSYDTVAPGYIDCLIDLGRFWREEQLEKNKIELKKLSAEKKSAYSRAYGYLSAALKASLVADKLIFPCVMMDKMRCAAARDVAKLGLSSGGNIIIKQTEAMGTQGETYLPTLTGCATRVHYVENIYGISSLYLGELEQIAKKEKYGAMISYDTVDRRKVREIFFTETADCFTSIPHQMSDEWSKINMKRFIDAPAFAEVRRKYRATTQCTAHLRLLAAEALAEAGKAHSELEKYYVSSMDFAALEKYCREFLDKLSPL